MPTNIITAMYALFLFNTYKTPNLTKKNIHNIKSNLEHYALTSDKIKAFSQKHNIAEHALQAIINNIKMLNGIPDAIDINTTSEFFSRKIKNSNYPLYFNLHQDLKNEI